MKKIILIIAGVVLTILGVVSIFFEPLSVYIAGAGVLLYGIAMIINFNGRRKTGTGGALLLAGGIAGICCGAFILLGGRLFILASHIILIILSAYFIAVGILEIISAVIYRKAMTSVDLGVYAPGSISSFVMGIIMVSFGAIGLFSPLFAAIVIRILVTALTILIGVRLILISFSTDKLWKVKN